MNIRKKNDGFTLLEIMVAVAVLGILVAGIYTLYTNIYNNYLSQNQLSEVEQNARIGIEQMMKEIRLTGYYNTVGNQIYRTASYDFVFQEKVQPAVGSSVHKKIEYFFDSANKRLLRGEELYSSSYPNPIFPSDPNPVVANQPLMAQNKLETVASNISALNLTYYDSSNAIFNTASRTDYTSITRVRVQLTAQGNQPSPDKIGVTVGGKVYKQVQVEADIRLRNMGIGQANAGTTAPAAPTGLAVYDTGNPCGSLTVQWNANTEPALAGYTLFYRIAGTTVPYTTVTLGKVTSSLLTGLQIGTTYAVTIKAYDNVGNYSNYGAVIISANATVGGNGVLDTQPNVTPPPAPTMTGATAGDKIINLTWSPTSAQGIPGYNIYRSANNGASWVLLNGSTPVNGTTYADTFPDIAAPNCPLTYQNKQPYQYKMATVDCSGTGSIGAFTLPVSGPDGGSPFNTYPKDSTPPADPSNFTGTAGTNQVILGWTAPSDPDIFGVSVLSKNGTVNNLTFNTYPASPTDLPRQVYLDSTVITPSQTFGFVDSPLSNNTVYTYTAYAFDKCGNFSPGAQSKTLAIPCGEATYPGPPSNPTSLNGSCCGTVRLTWNAPTVNGDGKVFNPLPGDVIGYNVYRCSSAPCTKANAIGWNGLGTPLNQYPVQTSTVLYVSYYYNDTTATTGQTYYYAVTAIDCTLPTPHESAYATTSGGAAYIALTPGGLTQDVYLVYGTSSGGNTSTTLNDTTRSFATWPAYQNGTLKINQGTDAGQVRPLTGNSATSLSIPTFYPWSTSLPDTTSQYEIDRPVTATGSSSSQTRDKVTFYVKNSSAGIIQIRNSDTAQITWTNYGSQTKEDYRNSTVYLNKIKVNGNTLWSSGGGVSSGSTVTFTSLGAALSINGLQSGIPMELYFIDKNGDPADMQGETINIVMTYGIPNPDGTYTTCTWSTLASPVSPVTVPLATNGWVWEYQQGNSTYTFENPSPGATIFQAGTGPISFYTYLLAYPGHYVTSATIYYCQQAWSVKTSSPPLPTDPCYSISPITVTPLSVQQFYWTYGLTLTPNISESGSPFRIWYYVQATDNTGNIGNLPDNYLYNGVTGFNAYTYDQYDKFNPNFTMSWTNNGTNRSIVVTGSVTDISGTSGNSPGATVTLTFSGSGVNTATATQTLAAGTNTWTSPNNFGGSENATVTLTLSKPGFGPNGVNVCGVYPNGPGAVSLAASVSNNTQVTLCP